MVDVNKLKEQLGVSDADLAKAQQWSSEQRERDEAAKLVFLREVTPLLLDLLGHGFDLGIEHAVRSMVQKMQDDDLTIAASNAGIVPPHPMNQDPSWSNGGSGSRDILR